MTTKVDEERRLFNGKDIIVIIIVLAAAFACLLFMQRNQSGTVVCEISLIGGESLTINLDQDGSFNFFGIDEVLLEVKDNAIRFAESDCRDKICVNTGFVSRSGQFVVCLPHKLVVRIYSKTGEDGPDTVVR